MGVIWCGKCGAYHDSGETCHERPARRSSGSAGPTRLGGALFQGIVLGVMFGFPLGQLTNRAEPFLIVVLSVVTARVGYHLARSWRPKKPAADAAAAPQGPQSLPGEGGARPGRRRAALVGGGLAALALPALLAGWWSQRTPTSKEAELGLAAAQGDLPAAKRLLDRGANPAGQPHDSFPPLTQAAGIGSVEVVRLLLDRGAGVNQKTWLGATALHAAISAGHLGVVQLLLERGADPALANGNAQTPLALAVVRPEPDAAIAKALLHAGAPPADWSALYVAPPERLTLLLEACPAPDAVSPDGGNSLLQWAARRGNLAGARALLEKGAEVDKAPPAGPRPLVEALRQKHPEAASLLLTHGASPDPASDGEPAPLELAVAAGLPETVALLLEKGARVERCPRLEGASAEKLVQLAEEARRGGQPAEAAPTKP